jgi:hypothetical protein
MPSHKFQLVLRLPEDCSLTSLDFEDDIAQALGDPRDDRAGPHMVDGNSYGCGTIEFFIFTSDPHAAFAMCKPLFESTGLLDQVVAAHRPFDREEFEVIWPEGFTGEFEL